MNRPQAMKAKKNGCLLAHKRSGQCAAILDGDLPLCERHKKELNKLTDCGIADHIRSNFVEKGDESIVFNQKSGDVYSLNSTGTFVFKELLAGKTFSEILKDSGDVFAHDDISEVIADFRLFVGELKKTGVFKAEEV